MARRLPRAPHRGAATVRWEHRRVLGGLRIGESGGRAPFWEGGNGPVGRLTAGVTRGLGSGCASGARIRGKGFASRAYRGVLSSEIKGARNLTGRLTACLTTSLTAHLTRSLTKSGVPSGREGGQTGLRDRLEAVSAFPLGGVEHFCHDAVVDSQSLLDDSFP